MHRQQAIDIFAMSRSKLEDLLGTIPDERWAEQPGGLLNHPAWTVPHLVVGMDFALLLLGCKTFAPEPDWPERFGNDTLPVSRRSRYPDYETLMATYRHAHDGLTAAVKAADDETFKQAMPDPGFRAFFPTIGHAIAYFLMSHEAHHFGQLTMWRRAADLVPA